MTVSYFIYYRVAQPSAAESPVRAMQSQLALHSGVRGRVLKKREDPALWMEVYEGVADAPAFEAALQRLVEAMALGSYLASGSTRKTECFEEPCV